MYALDNYDYHLPQERIAQQPLAGRDRSRLLCLDRISGEVTHNAFAQLPHFLSDTDVLVINDTEVIPGRLLGHKKTGGKVEVLLLDFDQGTTDAIHGKDPCYRCLIKAAKAPKTGTRILFDAGLEAEVLAGEGGMYDLRFNCPGDFTEILYKIGHVPLPPYIKRNSQTSPCNDQDRYQTVYAAQKGAVAAPTAGLHFSQRLLQEIGKSGVTIVPITLHVGYGTFAPVRVKDIREHQIHSEYFRISPESAAALNRAKAKGRRIVAVGTTCVRTLEYVAGRGPIEPGDGECDLFIYPGYQFIMVDAMITNFHLPKSTLLMLVSAFASRTQILAAYTEAIREKYRFYSYGDAMLIT